MLAALPYEDLVAIAEGCRVRSYEKGESVFHEGERADGFHVVQSGQIGVYLVTPNGQERVLSVFRPPQSFAEAVLAMEGYPANARALEYSRVILVRKAHFREVLARKPDLALQMLAAMSQHLKGLLWLLHDSRGRQAESRVAEWLLRQSPAATAGCPAVYELPVAKKVLASQLGLTSETLSRSFARLRKAGVIKVAGPRIHVLDHARLLACSEAAT